MKPNKSITVRDGKTAHARLAVFSLLLLWPYWASAYNGDGHQIVGAIADALLTPTTRAALKNDLAEVSLKVAGPWADCAKDVVVTQDNGAFKFAYQAQDTYAQYCAVFGTDALKKEFEDYTRRNCPNPKQSATNPTKYYCPLGEFHYTDVSVGETGYDAAYFGTSDHDVVASIDATLAYLESCHASAPGAVVPAPPFSISFQDRREAIWLLTHLVGDLHQPLHVGAEYLIKNPATGSYESAQRGFERDGAGTTGGNDLRDDGKNLHTEWDDASGTGLKADALGQDVLTEAKRVPSTPGDPATWPAIWASETQAAASAVFARASFEPDGANQGSGKWRVTFPNANAAERRHAIQRTMLIKAGARLAQLLNALYGTQPDLCLASKRYPGYLTATDLMPPLPAQPAPGGATDLADAATFFATRAQIGTDRGDAASRDDVYDADQVAPLFSDAYGHPLDGSSAAFLRLMMRNVVKDGETYLGPVKRAVIDGGRPRPFVAFPNQPGCPITYRTLGISGSFPSGHGTLGWLWAGVLSELEPSRVGELYARGEYFGQSRVVCGFHYPSDIEAGRQAAAAVLQAVNNKPEFAGDLLCAREQLVGKHINNRCATRAKALEGQ